jgi:outer membrane protein
MHRIARLLPRPQRAGACAAAFTLSAASLLGASAFAQSPDHALGAGLRWQPAFEGSDRGKVDVVPLVDWDRGALFVRTTRGVAEAGARLDVGAGIRVGAQLAWEAGRRVSDAPALAARGVGDLSNGASLGVFVERVGRMGPAPYSALVRLRPHLSNDRGAQGDVRLTVGLLQSGGLQLAGFAQGTWADSTANGASFGVTPALAARSGFAVYDAGGGLRQASAGLLGTWALSPQWALAGTLEARSLRGAARGSPLVAQPDAAAVVLGVTRTW